MVLPRPRGRLAGRASSRASRLARPGPEEEGPGLGKVAGWLGSCYHSLLFEGIVFVLDQGGLGPFTPCVGMSRERIGEGEDPSIHIVEGDVGVFLHNVF